VGTIHDEPRDCSDCGVSPGSLHRPGCYVKQCPACGGLWVSCACENAERESLPPLPWTGFYPGVEDCRRLGWYCLRNPQIGTGFIHCSPDHPFAVENLHRLARDGRWNRAARRYEAPRSGNLAREDQ
jgi:hypothetical protein